MGRGREHLGIPLWAGISRRITDKGLYGVLGADTETFGQPNLLGLTQEDQPDRPVTMLPTPPMPVKIDAAILNRRHAPHGAAEEAFNPASTEEGVLLETMQGAEVQIKLAKPVTVSSLAVWIIPSDGREDAKEMLFLADGKEVLKADLKREPGKQEFKLPAPVSFKQLVFRVVSVYPGPEGYGFVKQIGAFDEKGQRVWLYDYEPEIRSVKKVADVYRWMRKMQKTRPVFCHAQSGLHALFGDVGQRDPAGAISRIHQELRCGGIRAAARPRSRRGGLAEPHRRRSG